MGIILFTLVMFLLIAVNVAFEVVNKKKHFPINWIGAIVIFWLWLALIIRKCLI